MVTPKKYVSKRHWSSLTISMVILCFIGVLSSWDYHEAEKTKQQYCDSVRLFIETDGEYGRPPYKGESQCHHTSQGKN